MKVNDMSRVMIFIFLAIICTNIHAYGFGARHAGPIKKMITLTGTKSTTVAKIFGLVANGDHIVELRLNENHDLTFNLLQSGSDLNSNEGTKEMLEFKNVIEYLYSEKPSLSIGPFWFDLSTQGPFPKEGQYRFYSKDISVAMDGNDPWDEILRRLKQRTQWSDHTRSKIHLAFNFDQGNKLWIDVKQGYPLSDEKEPYVIGVTVYVKE